jgi:hypothetical protein
MRRIAIALILAAAIVGIHACAADSPTAPKPGAGGGVPSSAVSVQLVASDANPKAGTCTLIEAFVTLNGSPVPDGTSVNFSTDFGTYGQNGLPLISIITSNGTAVTALCGPGAGQAKVKGTATVQGKTNSGNVMVNFQPDSSTLPTVSFCNPSFGPLAGGTTLTLNGLRFFGTPSTTRVVFTVNGIAKDGIVTSVTSTQVTVTTPGFPEVSSPSAQAAVTLILGTNAATPNTLSLPSCFSYGAADSGTPVVSALLPSSGTNEGNTRVTIIGSGFSTGGVQVFFGTVEATVVSVSFTQVVALSPPAFGAGAGNLNASVPVTVKNINNGVVSNASVNFQYTPKVQITAFSNNTQTVGFLSPMTIYGQGFQAPVAVSLAGVGALVQSVAATEIVVLPGNPLITGCNDLTGDIQVTNIDTGDSADATNAFTYHLLKPAITGVSPGSSGGAASGTVVTITGINLPTVANAQVKFGSQTAFVSSSDGSTMVVTAPATAAAAPTCTGGNVPPALQVAATVDVTVTDATTTCTVTASGAFQYTLPCVATGP